MEQVQGNPASVFLRNLYWALKLMCFLPIRTGPSATPFQIVLAWIVAVVVPSVGQYWGFLSKIELSPYGLVTHMGSVALLIGALAIAVSLVRRSQALPFALLAVPIASAVSAVVYYAVIHIGDVVLEDYWAYIGVWALSMTPILIALIRLFPVHRIGSAWVGLIVVVIYGGAMFGVKTLLPQSGIFDFAYDETLAEEEVARLQIDMESVYYAQPQLMQQQTDGIGRGDPDKVEMFALLGAGYPQQGVFLREVKSVEGILRRQYDPAAIVTLANSAEHPEAYPMLNRRNLQAALVAMAEKMDLSQDIAFLFLTSHGSQDILSSAMFWGVEDISAEFLAEQLDNSGIRHAVIVVSACYSGSFIDELEGDGRLIITASAADRNSFGCADANEWTWWGRAFFDQKLRHEPDFRSAFSQAVALVSEWEEDAGHTPSQPQISIGPAVAQQLDLFLTQVQTRCRMSVGLDQDICLSDIWSPRK